MTLGTILNWMLCGLIVGLIARLLLPNRQGMGIFMTMLLGITGAIVGGFLFSLFQDSANESYTLSGNAWQGWIVAILGSVLLLAVFGNIYSRRSRE